MTVASVAFQSTLFEDLLADHPWYMSFARKVPIHFGFKLLIAKRGMGFDGIAKVCKR
jgi:hypothetical protein